MKEYGNFLNLEVIWKDDDMLELEITVSNNGYRGFARGYDTSERLKTLARQLDCFPGSEEKIFYKITESILLTDLSITFCRIDPTGLVGVKVNLEREGLSNCQNSRMSVELTVEPNSIDIFRQYLTTLAINQQGVAKLIAR